MADLTDDEFSGYVFRTLSPERLREIDRLAAVDEELAAEIELFRGLFPTSTNGEQQGPGRATPPIVHIPSAGRTRRPLSMLVGVHKRLVAAIVAITALAGVAVGAWAILVDRPLVQDNFNDRSFDAYLWMHQPEVERRFKEPMGISEKNGYLKLVNRGYLITREEFRQPISLSLDWQWVDLGPADPRYAENLTVTLRTTGRVSPKHPYEIEDGIRIMFNVWGPFINIVQRLDGKDMVLGSTEEPGPPIDLPISSDEWHTIRVTDDGETISVYMTGPKIAKKHGDKYTKTPLLRVRCAQKFEKYHIAIYNRELVGNAHESLIDNVVVRALPAKK